MVRVNIVLKSFKLENLPLRFRTLLDLDSLLLLQCYNLRLILGTVYYISTFLLILLYKTHL